MKSQSGRIFIAFVLNLFFSICEFLGGFFFKSVAIMSDAIHDAGDAFSIGVSYFLERKSHQKPDVCYTYGYQRFSVLGALITTMVLMVGSVLVIISACKRFLHPVLVHYDGMICLAIFGVLVNGLATYITHSDHFNERAVHIHMLEDVLGWVVVLVGAIIIKFTKFYWIDSVLCIFVAIFILWEAMKNFEGIFHLFMEHVPEHISVSEVQEWVLEIPGVKEVHHIHLWSMDQESVYLTMHVVSASKNFNKVKETIRESLSSKGITHITIEMEDERDTCLEEACHGSSVSSVHREK